MHVQLLYIAMCVYCVCVCVCVGGVGMGGDDLRQPSPVICKSHELTDYTCYEALVPSVRM